MTEFRYTIRAKARALSLYGCNLSKNLRTIPDAYIDQKNIDTLFDVYYFKTETKIIFVEKDNHTTIYELCPRNISIVKKRCPEFFRYHRVPKYSNQFVLIDLMPIRYHSTIKHKASALIESVPDYFPIELTIKIISHLPESKYHSEAQLIDLVLAQLT